MIVLLESLIGTRIYVYTSGHEHAGELSAIDVRQGTITLDDATDITDVQIAAITAVRRARPRGAPLAREDRPLA